MADTYFPRTQTHVNAKGFLYIVLIFLAILCIQKIQFFSFLNFWIELLNMKPTSYISVPSASRRFCCILYYKYTV